VTPVTLDRLTDGRAIAAVLRGRRQRPGHLAVVHVTTERASGAARIAVVASRRVGDAVTRNRAKRLLREAARHLPWREGTDVVLVARGACGESDLAHVHEEVRRLATDLGVLEVTDEHVARHETS
jgi:ribonuclease P protein component